jgi:glucose-1-phosphate adenylyltransferase
MTKDIIAMLLAGGVGSRLNILARHRAKPAIIFGGIYRIIDFTMSNVANSRIDVVGVLTQYKPLSLMVHLENGRPWDLFGRTRIVEILPPKTGEEQSDWYKGTSDAVYQNLRFIEDFSPEFILVVSGDHIYHMNYNELISFHKEKNAEATICLIQVPLKDASQFGLAEIDSAKKIINWTEKPQEPKTDLASMGVYIFNKDVLVNIVSEIAQRGGVDFAKDIIPVFLKRKKVYGFEFRGYWRDVGTIDAYWNANMDMLRKNSGLTIEDWRIKTNLSVKGEIGDRPSAYFGRRSTIRNSLIARGCVIEGTVQNSILSPGVKISQNTTVSDSIIFHDTIIHQGSVIEKCIIDKSVTIKENVRIGEGRSVPNKKFPHHLSTGITIVGKGAIIGSRMTIGKNCIIEPTALLDTMSGKNIQSGTTV